MQQDNNIYQWSFATDFNNKVIETDIAEVADLNGITEINEADKKRDIVVNNTITLTQIVAFDIVNGKLRYNPKEQVNRIEAFTLTPKLQPIKATFTCFNYNESEEGGSVNESFIDKAKDKFKAADKAIGRGMDKVGGAVKSGFNKVADAMSQDPSDKNLGKRDNPTPKPKENNNTNNNNNGNSNQGNPTPTDNNNGSGGNADPNNNQGNAGGDGNNGGNASGGSQNGSQNNSGQPQNNAQDKQETPQINGIDVVAYINDALGQLKHQPAARNFDTSESRIHRINEAAAIDDNEPEVDLYMGRSVQDFKNIAKYDDLEIRLQLLHLKVSSNKHIVQGEKNQFIEYQFDAKKVERYVNHYELKKLKLIINNAEVPPKTELPFISKMFRMIKCRIQLS